VGTPVSSTNKTNCHNITEILLKVALNIKCKQPICKTKEAQHVDFITKQTSSSSHQM
jgi:hypothetical protein